MSGGYGCFTQSDCCRLPVSENQRSCRLGRSRNGWTTSQGLKLAEMLTDRLNIATEPIRQFGADPMNFIEYWVVGHG